MHVLFIYNYCRFLIQPKSSSVSFESDEQLQLEKMTPIYACSSRNILLSCMTSEKACKLIAERNPDLYNDIRQYLQSDRHDHVNCHHHHQSTSCSPAASTAVVKDDNTSTRADTATASIYQPSPPPPTTMQGDEVSAPFHF